MKILHIVGDSKYGGGSVLILRLGQTAATLGHHVDVLGTDAVFKEKLAETELGLVNLDVIWRNIRPLRDIIGLYRLFKFLRRSDYTVVHTHTSKAGFVGRIAARLARVPVIVHTVHGFAFHEESPKHVIRLYTLLERVAAVCCDRVVTVSKFHRHWALQLGIANSRKIVAIPNGIPIERVHPKRTRDEVRRELGVAPGDVVVLAMGRLAPDKGLEYLVQAFAELATEPTPIRLLLVGDGPLRSDLETAVKTLGLTENVIMTGFRTDVADILEASDITVLASLREGLSITLLEGLAAAKPTIATQIGSNREVITDGQTGLLVRPTDVDALAGAIRRLAGDEGLRRRLGVAAGLLVAHEYTEQRMLRDYMRLYECLCEEKVVKKDV
jgi:glycosyltransferase involved in cell wall biosynthesis